MTQPEGTLIAVLQNDMKQVKADISALKTAQAAGFASLETKLELQDKKYASKWVQQVVGGLIALILISVVAALLALVIIPATKKPQETTATPATSAPATQATSATATSHSDTTTPSDSQTSIGGVTETLPKVQQ